MFQVNGLPWGWSNGWNPLAGGWSATAGVAPDGWAMQDTP